MCGYSPGGFPLSSSPSKDISSSSCPLTMLTTRDGVGVERHLWDHKNPYYGCRGAGLREEQD